MNNVLHTAWTGLRLAFWRSVAAAARNPVATCTVFLIASALLHLTTPGFLDRLQKGQTNALDDLAVLVFVSSSVLVACVAFVECLVPALDRAFDAVLRVLRRVREKAEERAYKLGEELGRRK
jgi:hypothetical protein